MSALSAQMCATAKLEAALLKRSAEYRKHAPRENEMTVWVRNGRVIYPAGSAVRLAEYGDLFGDGARVTSGTLSGVDGAEALKAILCAIPLEDGAYYVHWVDEGDDASLFTAYSDEQAQLLSSVEIAHGGFFLDIVDQGQGLEFGYKSFFFDSYETPEALGITRQFLEDRPKTLEIGGEQYHCAFRAIREGEETGVYLAQFAATADQMQNQAILITTLAGIILLAVTAWHLATQRLVVDKMLFIISGVWNRGFNLFAIVSILLLALVFAFGLMVMKVALKLTSMALDTKGETICRLCYNLLQYAAVLLLLFYAFEFFGIDVRALLAPLALVSLALSMGSRELVQDILAGITIVFEGEYQVGDVVDVGGYRGKVVEIGVRTTKLLGRGDNIKIISNRDVRNVLNMSRMNSWIDMEFTLSNTVPMQKLEEIMERELPEIGRSIPDIISGPIYKGIVSMNGNRVTVAVTCECNEEVSFRVQRELYAKFHEMFERESLPLA